MFFFLLLLVLVPSVISLSTKLVGIGLVFDTFFSSSNFDGFEPERTSVSSLVRL